MPFEMTIGLLLSDHEKYAEYRAASAPWLAAAGGKFRCDFEVARTLKTEDSHEINRLFVLQFPDRAARDRFFNDPRYLEMRSRLFETSVQRTTVIAEYGTLNFGSPSC